MTKQRDAAWLADAVRSALPKAKITVHKPRDKQNGGWVIDAELGKSYVVVMWTRADGFGIATPAEDEPYGTVPGEVHHDAGTAAHRVVHLLNTGEPALSRREMRMQELREHRSISQDALAKVMKVSQPNVSQTERRADVTISTLQSYVEGLGGRLRLVAEFPTESIDLDLAEPRAGSKSSGASGRGHGRSR